MKSFGTQFLTKGMATARYNYSLRPICFGRDPTPTVHVQAS